jgi:hypothetical protein
VSNQLHLICRGGTVNPIFCPTPGDGICLIVELGRTISFKHIPEKKVLDEHLPGRVSLDESNPSSVGQRIPDIDSTLPRVLKQGWKSLTNQNATKPVT